ncbi:hypothetical protein CUZ56_00082 [Saezia sanguinis]|uniref:Lipoprotein n=1 Tax=Saezia sanguinis TaxID=1965230 RepID=A0A433SFT5_9BURK|nr:hypothetical protein [Saezia sanguinis]RUS67607.1 hypothetical protein CUZ56_00082 [Saezia sanguinis]
MVMLKYGRVFILLCLANMLAGCSWLGWGRDDQTQVQTAPAAQTETMTYAYEPPATRDLSTPSNVVVAFFWDVNIRSETDGQRQEICRALNDMSALSAPELQQKRYADASGASGQWNLVQLLQAYFVPAQPVTLDFLYEDIEKPASREVIRQTLADMDDYCAGRMISPEVTGW